MEALPPLINSQLPPTKLNGLKGGKRDVDSCCNFTCWCWCWAVFFLEKRLIDWWFICLLMIYVIFLSYECFFSSNFLSTHCLPCLLGGNTPVKCISLLKLCNSEWQINFPIHFLSVPLLHLHLCLHHLGLNIYTACDLESDLKWLHILLSWLSGK